MKYISYLLVAATIFVCACKKHNIPAPSPSDIYTVTAINSPEPGQMLLTPYSLSNTSQGMVIIMDEKGNILQQQTTNGAAFCLNKWNIAGQTEYTFMLNDVNAYHIPLINQLTGYVVVTDSNLNEINKINLLPYNDITTEGGQNLDIHDFILLDNSSTVHYIAMCFYEKHVTNIPDSLHPSPGVTVVAPIIQEVVNGTVIWQWDGSDYPEFYGNSVEGNSFSDSAIAQDYMHMNSMYIDPRDNNLICSFRNQNQIIKINRTTGAIMWRLGGKDSDFPLSSDEITLHQHHATLTDSNQTLLVFDDGDTILRPYSRIVEYQLNETDKAITSFKAYNIPEPFSGLMGSVQKKGDTYFIGGGTANYVLEVNYVTGQKIFEMKGTETSYRTYKY